MGIGWIIAVAIAGLALWVTLDFLLGRKQHLKKAKKSTFPSRMSNVEIYAKGPQLFENLFTEIKNAKKHIHVLFYIIQDDKISHEFVSILKEKAREGVEVRLLVDWIGSNLKRKSIQSLKAAGVEFAFSHTPKFPFLFYSSQVRNHRKITVIDGETGYLGGFNIGEEYNDNKPKLSPWRDYHLKITGEGVRDLQEEFLHDWKCARKVNLLQNEIYFPASEKGTIRHQLIPTEGDSLQDLIVTLIRDAKQSLVIGSPYFIPSHKVFEQVQKAIKRGVKVTILVPYESDHILVKEASLRYLRALLQDGAEVYQYLNGFYHAKVMIIDDDICDIGTANFDKRSMFLNHEVNCLIYDPSFIKKVKHILTEDFLNSHKASLADFRRVNVFLSIKETAARTISFFL